MTTTQELVEAFLARGGKVGKVASDIGAGYTDRDWQRIVRGQPIDDNARIEQRFIGGQDHLGRDIITNGLGEIIGVE